MPLLSAPSSRPPAARGVAVAVASGALATTVAVTPAAARNDRGGSGTDGASAEPSGGDGDGNGHGNGDGGDWGGGGGRQEQGRHWGVVTADRLPLRTSPTRGGQVTRYAHRGETLRIRCKTPGDTIGPAPRWC
ncbi:SH3 domain-containing protein [Streptomyces sp. NPDC047853]|uniref:SH3 domain-containing protein n=1 Tax=unclassified Streptomyces TaxID=2593676 RepID=UPI00340EADA9